MCQVVASDLTARMRSKARWRGERLREAQASTDPTTMVFLNGTRDTAQRAALAAPATANRYTYAADNPTNNTGPTGQSLATWLGIGLVVLGLASGGVGFAIAFTAEATLASAAGGALAIADLGGALGSAYLTGQTAN